MTAHDPRVTLTDVLAAHVRLPMMHSQGCSCGWHASLSYPDLHRAHLAERIEEHIAARLAPIRALADLEDCGHPTYYRVPGGEVVARYPGGWCSACSEWQEDLRAALDAAGAPVSASQDHDGTHGPPETNRPSDHQQRLRATFLAAALEDQ